MSPEALTTGPVFAACWLLVAFTVTLDVFILLGGPRQPRPCCTEERTWRTPLDRLNAVLLPARLIAWGYIATGDVLLAAQGDPQALRLIGDVIVIVFLWLEMQHRRSHRRQRRRRQRAAGRVVNLGHRLAVQP